MNRRTFLQATAGLTGAGVVATGPANLGQIVGPATARTTISRLYAERHTEFNDLLET